MRTRMHMLLFASLVTLVTMSACRGPKVTEFVNITFTTSVDTSGWRTWAFDMNACVDSGDERLDDARLREELLKAIEGCLADREYEQVESDPDFYIHYVIRVVATEGDLVDRGEGSIVIRDADTGRRVWRGERRAPLVLATSAADYEGVKTFVEELLQFTQKLKLRLTSEKANKGIDA